jgi:hypothetical protein
MNKHTIVGQTTRGDDEYSLKCYRYRVDIERKASRVDPVPRNDFDDTSVRSIWSCRNRRRRAFSSLVRQEPSIVGSKLFESYSCVPRTCSAKALGPPAAIERELAVRRKSESDTTANTCAQLFSEYSDADKANRRYF